MAVLSPVCNQLPCCSFSRVVMQFESTINQYLCGTARLTKPMFPVHCFRVRESTEHHIYLNHDSRQYSHNQGNRGDGVNPGVNLIRP